jgi:hypothetical protein
MMRRKDSFEYHFYRNLSFHFITAFQFKGKP